jgi:hypothetical protein
LNPIRAVNTKLPSKPSLKTVFYFSIKITKIILIMVTWYGDVNIPHFEPMTPKLLIQ